MTRPINRRNLRLVERELRSTHHAIPSVSAAPVEQATLTPTARASVVICQSIGSVKLAPNISGVNVRAEPSYTALIIADAIKPGTTYPVEAASGAFYKLCASGWVAIRSQSGQALLVFTAAPPTATPAPTVTQVASTPTPRPTPTRIEPQRMYCRAGSVTVTPVAPGRELVMCEEWQP